MKLSEVVVLFISFVLMVSCSKTKPGGVVGYPQMQYINLHNREVKPRQPATVLDLDNDGVADVFFSVMLVGDPVYQVDKTILLANSSFYSNLFVNNMGETPVYNMGDIINGQSSAMGSWYNASSVPLMEKRLFMSGASSWHGNWRYAQHRFMAVQVTVQGRKYNGWVEISAAPGSEQIILHGAAISKEPEKNVLAGK